MKSQSISSGRHETVFWECVETEKEVRTKRALPDLPGTWYQVPGTRNLRGGTGVLVDFGSCTWYQGYTQFQESLQVNPNQGCDSVKDSQVMVESWSRRLDCERQIYMCYATGV